MSRVANDQIEGEAVAWLARQDRGPLSDTEQERFDAWLTKDSRHLGAFTRAQAVWISSERAGAMGLAFAGEQMRGRPIGRRMIAAGIAAAVIGPAAVAMWPKATRQSYRTRKGEISQLTLADGSSIVLSTNTAVHVVYARQARQITIDGGDVLINATFEKDRPLLVKAATSRFTCQQASFAVHAASDAPVRALVRSGQLEADRDGWKTPVEVRPLQDIVMSAQPTILNVDSAEVDRQLAWRDGVIAFEGESLAEAADRFDSFSPVRLVINQPDVAAERITGRFSASDPVGFARAVAGILDLQVWETDHAVHLARRKI